MGENRSFDNLVDPADLALAQTLVDINYETNKPIDSFCTCDLKRIKSFREPAGKEVDGSSRSQADKKIVATKEKCCAPTQLKNSEKNINILALVKYDHNLMALTGVSARTLNFLDKAVQMIEKEDPREKFPESPRERIVLCLCKLRMNLSFKCLSVLFNMTLDTCYKNFKYMVELLSEILTTFIVWPTYEQQQNNPQKCTGNFHKTRAVLGCIEIPTGKFECHRCEVNMYSKEKHCGIIKFLIGTTSCGCITFVSEAYGGRAPNKDIFNQSFLVDQLDPSRDVVVVDQHFDINLECLEAQVKLIKPPSSKKNCPISHVDALYTNQIAAARVPIERLMLRMKTFSILTEKIVLPTKRYVDHISQVIAGLMKLNDPVLPDDQFL